MYNPAIHNDARPNVGVTVALLAFDSTDRKIKTLVYHRKDDAEVFAGKLSLPNCPFDRQMFSSLDEAAVYSLDSKTDIKTPKIEQLYTFCGDYIDPERIITINTTYFSTINKSEVSSLNNESNTYYTEWIEIEEALNKPDSHFAFNHKEVLSLAWNRLKAKAEYTPVALSMLGESFTITEFRELTEMLIGTELNDSRFRDRVKKSNLLVASGNKSKSPTDKGGKPAAVFSMNSDFKGEFFPRSLTKPSKV